MTERPAENASDPIRRGEQQLAEALLARALTRARYAILWERLWPALAALASVIGIFLVVSWAGLWLALPPIGRDFFQLYHDCCLVDLAQSRQWPFHLLLRCHGKQFQDYPSSPLRF